MSGHEYLYKARPMTSKSIGKWLVHLLHDCVKGRMDGSALEKRVLNYLGNFEGVNRRRAIQRINALLPILSGRLLDFSDIMRRMK